MLATMDWVQWYNEDRAHSYSGDMPPRKYEEIYYQALRTANKQLADIAASRLAEADQGLLECSPGDVANGIRKRPLPFA